MDTTGVLGSCVEDAVKPAVSTAEGEEERHSDDDNSRKRKEHVLKRRNDESKLRREEERDEGDARDTTKIAKSKHEARMNEDMDKKKTLRVTNREDMVQNAVQFLTNPSVRSTPLARKVAFLERKGLSSEEIKEALRRSGETRNPAPEHEDEALETPHTPFRTHTVQSIPRPRPTPTATPYSSWRGAAIVTTSILGVSGGLAYLAKNYIVPHLWHSTASIQTLKDANVHTNQIISDIKGQMVEFKESLSSLKVLLAQQTPAWQESKPGGDEVAQLKHELAVLSSGVTQQLLQDEQTREITELKAQISTLKASITARQSAAAPPPIPSNRSTLTWSPVDNPKQIPSWQRPVTPTAIAPSIGQSAIVHSPPALHEEGPLPQQSHHTPYSQSYLDIISAVNEHLPPAELNKRLGIRSDINDKPAHDHPITKGTKLPRSKPWENTNAGASIKEESEETTPNETLTKEISQHDNNRKLSPEIVEEQ